MKQNDQKYLKDFASKVISGITEQQISSPFNIAQKIKVREVGTDGWAVQLGIFRGYACSVEIWFDKFTSHENRKIYYGLYSRKTNGIQKIATLSKPYLGGHTSISKSSWADNVDIIHLKKRLTIKEFGKPVFEKFSNEYLYGIYEYEKFGLQRNETKRLVSRVVEFTSTINEALLLDKSKQETEEYKAIENRKAVQRHIQRERRSHLATLRKQYDDFVCQVCGFDYTLKYGSLGEDFAEAHHIVPLAKNDKQRTSTIVDLITVCANCHRMLHRMNGETGDIAKLKKIVSKKK